MQVANKLQVHLSEPQSQVYANRARFRVLVAGRRFGKTQLAFVELLRTALQSPAQNVWYVAPSYRQAKRIAWNRLKDLVSAFHGVTMSETELTVEFSNHSAISLRGADNYESLRGNGLDFVVLDEFASMKPEVWSEVLRPALTDRKGRALFIGTPQGHNHLYDRFQFASGAAAASLMDEPDPDWAAFQFTTLDGGFVDADELAGAARELDETLFRQEFEASFESTALGRAYHAFSRQENILSGEYWPGERLVWSLDFNVNPMCSILAQAGNDAVHVLEELVLDDANTQLACERLWDRVRLYRRGVEPLVIDIYGDASGYQRRTCGSATDWTIIRNFFAQLPGQVVARIKASTSNPGVRDRVNQVNARLLNAAGERRLFIDPKCKELILDLERVCWQTDAFGQPTTELDKSDRKRTHLSDALGYFIAQAFPLGPTIGDKSGRLIW